MKCVAEIVDRQLDGVSVDGQTAMVDAVGITSDGCSEVGLVILGKISLYAVKTQHYIAHPAIASRHLKSHNASAIVGDGHFHAAAALDAVEGGGLAVDFRHKLFGINACHHCRLVSMP